MPFSDNIKDRERDRFVNLGGETAVRTLVGNGGANPIPVYVTSGSSTETTSLVYNQITSVAAAVESTVITYTVPPTNSWKLKAVHFNGNNVATYKLKINSVIKQKEETYFTKFSGLFLFDSGLTISAGDVLTLTAEHNRPYVGDFNASLLLMETT